MHLAYTLPLALFALVIEAVLGYPDAIYRRIGHPVTWMGAWLAWLEARLNREGDSFGQRRAKGILALALLLGVSGGIAFVVEQLLAPYFLGLVALAAAAAALPAQISLYKHVRAVSDALESATLDENFNERIDRDLAAARRAVGMIVGRNTDVLDEAGVARAAIESLAENFSDGIVAPAFWLAVGGLTGGVLYKAINTADSMIGHRSERYLAFGWASARLDDGVNLPASRLAALCFGLAALIEPGASASGAWRAVWRDAGKHRSPNAGWPEAAMAGALDFKLAGPRVYGTELVQDVFMGDGRRDLAAGDIVRALRLYGWACTLLWVLLAAAWLALIWRG